MAAPPRKWENAGALQLRRPPSSSQMLNASDHFRELLCPAPRASSLVSRLPTLRRYLFHDGPRALLLPCWSDVLRVEAVLPTYLSFHAPPPASLWLSLLFFLFCCSVLLARYLVLRSIRKEEADSEDAKRDLSQRRLPAFDGRDNSVAAEIPLSAADFEYYADDWPDSEDPGANDVVLEGEALLFLSKKETEVDTLLVREGQDVTDSSIFDEDGTASESVYASPVDSLPPDKLEVIPNAVVSPTPTPPPANTADAPADTADTVEEKNSKTEKNLHNEGKNFSEGEKGFSTVPHHVHDARDPTKKSAMPREEGEDNAVCYDSSTVGSTSKSSAEWRSSANLRDSETEHLFSSSSRRSSSKWESYAVFRKYDEEMMFFDRISAQKLNEAESLRSVKVHPRSISQRIVHKLITTKDKNFARFKDPYRELEAAYVAQICLTWEALNWNYRYFQQLHAKQRGQDNGCSALVAQQFQQFQVLLQRFIENEPYQYGRRPEVYARMRTAAPKFLQVPEFHDLEDKKDKGEVLDSRIPSAEFLGILEDAILTFMNFLRADRENHWQMLRALVTRKRPSLVDPALLHLLRKVNEKKRRRLKDLLRRGRCLGKRRPRQEDEMETVMALMDMRIVARVLRMPDIVSEEQLHWCEEKMSRVKVWEGRMQRDSSPLFFPAH